MAKREVRANIRDIVDAYDCGSDEIPQYLDLETGEVVVVTDEEIGAISEFFEQATAGSEEDGDAAFAAWLAEESDSDRREAPLRAAYEAELGVGDRFFRIPLQQSHDGYRDMEDFADTVTDERLSAMLSVALNGRGAFRRFKDVLCDYPDERERWFSFKEERQRERVMEWLADEEIEIVEP